MTYQPIPVLFDTITYHNEHTKLHLEHCAKVAGYHRRDGMWFPRKSVRIDPRPTGLEGPRSQTGFFICLCGRCADCMADAVRERQEN